MQQPIDKILLALEIFLLIIYFIGYTTVLTSLVVLPGIIVTAFWNFVLVDFGIPYLHSSKGLAIAWTYILLFKKHTVSL